MVGECSGVTGEGMEEGVKERLGYTGNEMSAVTSEDTSNGMSAGEWRSLDVCAHNYILYVFVINS